MDDPPLQRSNTQLNVCIVGAGPAGLLVAIGLAQQGHDVVVLDALPHPSVRGTVNRDRSYPVDITARGMLALSKFGLGWKPEDDEEGEKYSTKVANGMTEKNRRKRKNAMRARLLPFMGHAHWHNQPSRPGAAPGKRCAVPGLIGTRDDIVFGLLDHIETVYGKVPFPAADGKAEARPGSVRVFCGLSVEAVDIRQRTVSVAESKKETNGVRDKCSGAGEEMTSAAMKAISDVSFDLVVACDGKHSVVRTAAKHQDNLSNVVLRSNSSILGGPIGNFTVTRVEGRAGENFYKTFTLMDTPPSHPELDEKVAAPKLHPGWLYMVGGAPPRGCIISVVPSGGAIGIMPFDESELVFPDEKSQVEKLSARENPASASLLTSSRAVPRAPSGALQRRLPRELLQLISQDEQKDFEARSLSNAGGGFRCSRLFAGVAPGVDERSATTSNAAVGEVEGTKGTGETGGSCGVEWFASVVLVGDAATSPPPPGQGVNHAFEAAAALVAAFSSTDPRLQGGDAEAAKEPYSARAEKKTTFEIPANTSVRVVKRRWVTAALVAYDAQQRPDEAAYAYLGAPPPHIGHSAARFVGSLLGMHPVPGPGLKDSTARYSEITRLNTWFGL